MEVKVTKCQNGHYFDLNKHTSCPHCGAAEFTVSAQSPKKSGLCLFKKKSESIEFAPERKTTPGVAPKSIPAIKVEDITPTDSPQAFVIEDVVTEGAFSDENGLLEVENVETEGFFSNSEQPDVAEDIVTTGMFSAGESLPIDVEPTVGISTEELIKNDPTPSSSSSLLEEIRNATADNEVRTVGIFSLGNSVPVTPASVQEPAVGWLVCVKGKNIGKDFKIIAGKNSIGRSNTNVIIFENEETVSREKHAWIIYEPRKREFFVKPGESSGLTYLNDENIFDAKKLHSGDTLEFGDAKFVFVPLCGENFSWSDYINKE